MKTIYYFLVFFYWVGNAFGQTLYIHFVSHNEPNDNLQNTFNYQKAKNNVLQMAMLIQQHQMAWNLQTSDGFVMGARQDQQKNGDNIFRQLSRDYGSYIEIDPRNKNLPGRNIADQWFLLDSLGARPSLNVGGFIYEVCNGNRSQIDWWPYQDTISGLFYQNKVKFKILSGAGSLPPHCNDLNDFGIFKPDTVDQFYTHNPKRNLWCVGTGCAPVLDSSSDEMAIFQLIRGQADSIYRGVWPKDKMYVTRIMTNQRSYGPLFFQKVQRLMDSLETLPQGQLTWKTISGTFQEFEKWKQQTSNSFTQWSCGQIPNSLDFPDDKGESLLQIFPNPGRISIYLNNQWSNGIIHVYNQLGVLQQVISPGNGTWIDVSDWSSGLYYFVSQSGQRVNWLKQE